MAMPPLASTAASNSWASSTAGGQVGDGEVVEQEGGGAGVKRFAGLLDVGDFDLDGGGGAGVFEGGVDGVGDRADGGDVVVFEQDAGGEGVAVVEAAAAADGIAFGGAEAGGGFARVEDLGVAAGGGGGHGGGGEGGRAGETLEPVEGGALGAEEVEEVAADGGEHVACGDGVAVGAMRGDFDVGIERLEGGGGEGEAADDAVGAGDDLGGPVAEGCGDRLGGEVEVDAVFVERVLDEAFDQGVVERDEIGHGWGYSRTMRQASRRCQAGSVRG